MARKKSTKSPRQSKAISDAQAKSIRSGLSKLKRKGLYSGDVRTIKITKSQQRLVDRYQYVLAGKERVTKVSKKDIPKLRAAGVEVRKGRAITPSSVRVGKGGKLVKVGAPRGAGVIHRLDEALTLEESIRAAFRQIPHPYGMAFTFWGSPSYHVFQTPEETLDHFRIFYSTTSETEIKKHVIFFAPDVPPEIYAVNRSIEKEEADRLARDRKRLRDRERSARKRGERASRGH
jgi:hypothetical protein